MAIAFDPMKDRVQKNKKNEKTQKGGFDPFQKDNPMVGAH